MKKKAEIILIVLNVLSWIALIGLMIKAGAILISYGVSIANPVASKNLYLGWDLHAVQQFDFWHYTGTVMTMVAILILEAYAAFLVTRVLSAIQLASPFTLAVAKIMERICTIIIFIWVLVLLYNGHIFRLSKQVPDLQEKMISGDFVFFAGLVFVLAQVFKRGVEIQSENELTI